DSMKRKEIGREEVHDKFGVYPERVVDVQALTGDSSDNIPGAPGIGAKTAPQLIEEFGDLESLLANADQIPQEKRRAVLTEHADQIRMCKELVQLRRDAPLSVCLDELAIRDPDPNTVFAFLLEQEFRTIVRRAARLMKVDPPQMPEIRRDMIAPSGSGTMADIMPIDPAGYECVIDDAALDRWLATINDCGFVAIDTETTGLNEMEDRLVGISLCCAPGQACYIPLQHKERDSLFGAANRPIDGQLGLDHALERLTPMLTDPAILKIGQNIKFDLKIFKQHGVTVEPVDDTMLLAYALHSGLHNLNMTLLSEKYLNHKPIPIEDLIGKGRKAIPFQNTKIADATRYAAEDADITLRLWQTFKPRLPMERVATVYETLDRPLIPVLVDMERHGIRVDADHLHRLSQRFGSNLAQLESSIFKIAGQSFNIGSPMQLGRVMFEDLNLPGGEERTLRGYKTDARILEDLAAAGYDFPKLVLDWRHLSKLRSTYTEALPAHINEQTDRVHTSYRIAGANTGRLASSEPNLQNIPIRTSEGRSIREACVAEEGYKLVSLDYSQIELRVLAHKADITSLKEAFSAGQDIHAMTASQVFEVPLSDVDPDNRRQAKAINFGVIYGISAYGLARNLGISRHQAQDFITLYFQRFPGIRGYMDQVVRSAKKDGYVTTLFGRKIHTPSINSGGPQGQFARRAAINAPIQGSAADIIRRAMIRLAPAMRALPARMLLQVHDELVFEVRDHFVEEFIALAKPLMESADRPALAIEPHLVVDAGVADNWADAH
ncbi:MAG: DNA polymerase I, partial [Rhodobacteraceae bacterium]|nr:DNA polymerase I [Paracoccaceae bacterium]